MKDIITEGLIALDVELADKTAVIAEIANLLADGSRLVDRELVSELRPLCTGQDDERRDCPRGIEVRLPIVRTGTDPWGAGRRAAP